MSNETNVASEAISKAAPSVKPQFTRKELLASERYRHKQDLICALITDNETCTREEVDRRIESYLSKEVE